MVRSQLMRLWRAKTPLITAVVAPILLMLIAGIVFSGGYGLRVGAYVPAPSALTEEVLSALEQNGVAVQRFVEPVACEAAVRAGDRNACLLFSSPFGISEPNNTIAIVIDGANLALAGVLSDGLYGNLEGKTTSLSTALTSQLVAAIDTVRKHAADAKTSLVQATTYDNNALIAVRNAQGSSQGFDVAFDVSGLGVSGAVSGAEGWRNTSALSLGNAMDRLNRTIVLLANASLTVKAFNTSMASNVSGQLDNATAALSGVKEGLSSLNSSATASARDLNASLTVLVGQLVEVRQKLDSAAGAKQGVEGQLSAADASLNQVLISLTTLQQSLDAITSAANSITFSDPERIARPIRTVVRPLAPASKFAGIFPVLLVLVVVFGGLLLAPRLVGMERDSAASVRLAHIVPVEMQAVASVLTAACIVLAQALVLIVASLLFGATAAPVGTFVVLVLIGMLFVALGTALGYAFDTEESAMIASFSLGIALFLLSGLLFPLTVLPGWLGAVNAFNPLLVGGNVLRQVALLGTSVAQASGIAVLVLGMLVSLLLVWLALSRDRLVALVRRR